MMLAEVAKKQKVELINPAEYLTLSQVAELVGVHRSRVVFWTKETWRDGRIRLPVREFFGVQVVHVSDLERVRDRRPGKPKAEGQ